MSPDPRAVPETGYPVTMSVDYTDGPLTLTTGDGSRYHFTVVRGTVSASDSERVRVLLDAGATVKSVTETTPPAGSGDSRKSGAK